MTSIYVKEKAAQGTPTAAYGQIWAENTVPASFHIEDDAGGVALVSATLSTAAQPNITSLGTLTALTVDAPAYIKEQASASGDTAAYGQIWVKDDAPNTLWFTNDDGTDAQVATNYVEGTWTPILSDLTNDATLTTAQGYYTRIGDKVFIDGRIIASSKGSMSGSLYIEGLPITSDSSGNRQGGINIVVCNGASLSVGESMTGFIIANSDRIQLYSWDATAGTTALQDTEVSDTFQIRFTGVYTV